MWGLFSESEITKNAPTSLLTPKCGKCGLFKTCNSPKMKPTGQGRKEILVLAEAPGKEEDAKGVQLVGNSGRELESKLRRLGINMRRDCWLTNVLICRPPNNRTPTASEIECCRPNLVKTIRELKPKVVILLGGTAVAGLIGWLWKENPGPITRWVGWDIPCQELNCWLVPTYHPAYLLRMNDPVLDSIFMEHLELAVSHKERPWKKVPNWPTKVKRLYTIEEAYKTIKKIERLGGTIAFDYETNCLKPETKDSKIVSCSICWEGKRTFAFPWFLALEEAMRSLLQSPCRKIAANLKFEDRWTRKKLGIRVRNWYWDTMIAAHVLDNRQGVTGLKFQAFVQLGMADYDSHISKFLHAFGPSKLNRVDQIGMDDLLLYNGLDSLLEYKLAMIQMEKMK